MKFGPAEKPQEIGARWNKVDNQKCVSVAQGDAINYVI
jgi:hypothetical protein